MHALYEDKAWEMVRMPAREGWSAAPSVPLGQGTRKYNTDILLFY